MKRYFILIAVVAYVTAVCGADVETWRATELAFEAGTDYDKTGADAVTFDAVFTHDSGEEIARPGFWDGGKTFRVRFAPTKPGRWRWITTCRGDATLDGRSGELSAKPYAGELEIYKRGFVTVAKGAKHFTYADGTPFFYLGDTHWGLYTEELDEPGPHAGTTGAVSHFKYIVDRRAEQGFTVYQTEPIGAKFDVVDGKVDASDIPGFQLADRYYQYLAEKGFVHANAEFFFASGMTKALAADPAAIDRLSRYWVARFGAYPVMWTLAQEVDNDFYLNRHKAHNFYCATNNPWVTVAECLHRADAYRHPLTAHQEDSSHTTVTGLGTKPGDPDKFGGRSAFADAAVAARSGHTWWGAQWSPSLDGSPNCDVARDYWADSRPAVIYEGRYCYLWTKDFGARAQGYISFLSGMFGYGYGAIDMWLYLSTYDVKSTSNDGVDKIMPEDKQMPWCESVKLPSALQMTHLKKFFTSFDWWNLKPGFCDTARFTPHSGTAGTSTNGIAYVFATLANPNRTVFYFYSTNLLTGTVHALTPDRYHTVRWFNTRTGEWKDESHMFVSDGCGRLELPPKPDAKDWALVVTEQLALTRAPKSDIDHDSGGVDVGVSLLGIEKDCVWGGRKAHLAVVNPVLGDEPRSVVSLRGEWEFTPKNMMVPCRNGIWDHFYRKETWPELRTMGVPGCWEAQGVGEAGMSECWDAVWDNCKKPIRSKHMGDGWYRKTVGIPAEWKGKRIWLKVGGVKSCGWFWVNGKPVALVDNYCGTYKYEISDLVTAGSNATIVAQVNNCHPSRKGLMSIMHKWGGIYRDVEIEATPQTFIDDAWVRGDFKAKCAEAHVVVCPNAESCKIRFTVDGKSATADVVDGDDMTLRLPLANFRAWSPEHPNLYTGIVELVKNGRVVHTRRERFGVRMFEARGKEFYLNGKPFFVRGFGDDAVYPLTGLSSADRDFHRAHLAKAREAGFNFVRLHTHCELPEYFEAADELGIMIQAELPYYSDVATEGFAFDPKRDVTELWRNYRRYPSFAVYSMGNEGSFGTELDRQLHFYVKAMDSDRLKINQDCHEAWINPPEAADYLGGPINVWSSGSVNPDRPFVTHEYLNLCIKVDSRDEIAYTGAWLPPVTRKSRADWLAKFGLGMEWGDRLQDAQHALQRHYQKNGVEAARRDPYCDGYCFWTIVDVVVAQGASYTAQGLFNPFWGQKRGGFSAADFAKFNSPSCVLLDVPDDNRVVVSGDALTADFFFVHYGEAALQDEMLEWGLSVGEVKGSCKIGDIALGPARKVASQKIVFPCVEKPIKATLSARVGNVSNDWNFWVFPHRERRDGRNLAVSPSLKEPMARLYDGFVMIGTSEAKKATVVVAEAGSPEAEAALKAGRRVVAIGKAEDVPNVKLGWWWMGDQVGTALLRHPGFGDLPHEGHLSPLLFRIVGKGKPLDGAGYKEDDLFMIGEGGKECFAYLAKRKVGEGVIVESFGLDLLSGRPEGTVILDGMIDYARKLSR